MKRNNADLKKNIKEQLRFIKNSCSLYDKSKCNQIEALRVATALNILLNPGRYKGLLQLLDFQGKILSTVPKVVQTSPEKLKFREYLNKDEMESFIAKNPLNTDFNLFLITSSKEWFLYTNYEKKNITCSIDDIGQILFSHKNCNAMLGCLVRNLYENGFTEERKEVITYKIANLLGNGNYCPALFLPFEESNHLENSIKRYVSLEDWLNEIIFCAIPDDKNTKRHILTRERLIKIVRDKDGGAHVDKHLDDVKYLLSKRGISIAEYPHKKITTKNHHLCMLRKLGYEILNSPDITEF